MNTTFERTKNSTDEWYTPKEIIDALGIFDTDPCAPPQPLWRTAGTMYNKHDNGLIQQWHGRVWLNPPYSRPLICQFLEKMSSHNNGIALLFNRCDSTLFQEYVLSKCSGILFLNKRIKFFRPDGTQGHNPGCGSILVAYGENNLETLKSCPLQGKLFIPAPNTHEPQTLPAHKESSRNHQSTPQTPN